ncbi:MAG: hypothetical protein ACI8UR_001196 [Natronomonas sp.]|jgi:hypothetical protein|uniref:DUF4013 domain-containing protein n=1 Tax=Natronomonas sp. TaxID=2184060 RepID=UPI003989935F
MFREALDYPTRPPAGGRAVLIGGALLLLLFMLVVAGSLGPVYVLLSLLALLPWLIVRGYYVQVVRTTIGHDYPTPPQFTEYGRLLSDGFKALVIAVLYVLPAVVVLGPLIYIRSLDVDLGTVLAAAGLPSAFVTPALSGIGMVALFAFMYLIGALYAIPVGVALFAYTGRFRAAFDLQTVASGAGSEDYVVAWFVSLLLQVLLLPIAYALRVLLIGFFIHFLVSMAVRYCYGRGVGRALDLDPLVPDKATEPSDGTPWDEEALTPAVRPVSDSADSDRR